MKNRKRNLTMLAVLMFVCAAVALNWSYNNRWGTPDSEMVSAEDEAMMSANAEFEDSLVSTGGEYSVGNSGFAGGIRDSAAGGVDSPAPPGLCAFARGCGAAPRPADPVPRPAGTRFDRALPLRAFRRAPLSGGAGGLRLSAELRRNLLRGLVPFGGADAAAVLSHSGGEPRLAAAGAAPADRMAPAGGGLHHSRGLGGGDPARAAAGIFRRGRAGTAQLPGIGRRDLPAGRRQRGVIPCLPRSARRSTQPGPAHSFTSS